MTKRQREILNVVVRAGGSAEFIARNLRHIKPIRALALAGAVHYRWCGITVKVWVGTEPSFEGPIEPEHVARWRFHVLGYDRKGWGALTVPGGSLPNPFGPPFTLDSLSGPRA